MIAEERGVYQRGGLIHAIAECTECVWRDEDYKTAQAKARRHARTTGHRVRADLGYVVEYKAAAGKGVR